MAAPAKSLTYGSYLRTAELLSLQHRLSDAHDELQFIVVHQVFELWFKLMLFELESVRDALDRDDLPTAVRLLRRVAEVSRQFREIEFLSGAKDPRYLMIPPSQD